MKVFATVPLFSESVAELDAQQMFIHLVGICLASDVKLRELFETYLGSSLNETSVVTPNLGAEPPLDGVQEVGGVIDVLPLPPSLEKETCDVSQKETSYVSQDESSEVTLPAENDSDLEEFPGACINRRFVYNLVAKSDKISGRNNLSTRGYSMGEYTHEDFCLRWCAILSVLVHIYSYKLHIYRWDKMLNRESFSQKLDSCSSDLMEDLKELYLRSMSRLTESDDNKLSYYHLVDTIFDDWPDSSECRWDYPSKKLFTKTELLDVGLLQTWLMDDLLEVVRAHGWDTEYSRRHT